METLEDWLGSRPERSIETFASYIGHYLDEAWESVLRHGQRDFERIYENAGEAAYAAYAQKLFRPLRSQLIQAGWHTTPSFPGTLATSREWGPMNARERWMWCTLGPTEGSPIGGLVVRLVHDHTRFRIPSPPGILAVYETETADIIRAVSLIAGHPLQ